VENIQGEIKQEGQKLDQIFDYSRLYNSAGSNATRSQAIHPILMSIILEHYKQLDTLRKSVANQK